MDGSSGPAPFLLKTYEMVDDRFTNAIVSWSQSGHSFVVWNPPEFARDLLPKYFKHNNFSSFIRQLNTYGFRKVDPEQWEFANEEFIRGKTHLLRNIHRRKPTHSHSGQGNAIPLTDSEREEFEKKIGMLRQENITLQSELERCRQEGQGYGDQLRSLGQVLQNIDFRHRRAVTTLAQLLQKPPAYPSVIMEPLESHAKKRRLLAAQILHDEGSLHIATFLESSSSSSSFPSVNMEQVEKLDSALTSLEKFLHGVELTPTEALQGFTTSRLPSTIITEMSASSGDSDFNKPPGCHMSASSSRDSLSSPELAASSTHAESTAISSIFIDHLASRQKLSGIDMNMGLTRIPHTQVPEDGEQDATDPSVPSGTNDIFWQQFLTEAPASTRN